MTTDEWNAVYNQISESRERLTLTVKETTDTFAKIFECIDVIRDRVIEAWEQIAHASKEVVNALVKIFEHSSVTNEYNSKSVKTSFNRSRKKNYVYKNPTPVYKVEKRNLKHLPYQRRYY